MRARRRRRRRAGVVLLIATIVVVGGFGYALAYVQGWGPGKKPEPSAVCTTTKAPDPPQSKFELNVYNASKQQGAANEAALAIKSRKFDVGVVGNDPYKKRIDGVGEIRFGTSGNLFARKYVAELAPGAVLVEDGRTDTSVDIAIGSSFPKLPTVTATPAPKPTC